MSEQTVFGRNIHWFPGHMMRTMRNIEKKLPLVDGVVQLLDARIVQSSLNPDLQRLYMHKPRLYVLNKSDLADQAVTAQWLRYFSKENSTCVALNSKKQGAAQGAREAVEKALEELLQHRKDKGMSGAPMRLMITGIPNVGKSTFINNWVGSAKAKAADKPGVTRGEQWIKAVGYELLDMPGVLYKRFENLQTAVNLALIGSIPNNLLDMEEMAAGFLEQAVVRYPERMQERYKIDASEIVPDGWDMLALIGKKRGMLVSGGEVDMERAAIMVLDEMRGGKIGRISLELPKEIKLEL